MDTSKINAKVLSMFGYSGSMLGYALNELIVEHPELIVLSADMSTPSGLDKFKSEHPEHFYNLGIAEQNMIGTAAGLCDEGYRTISVAQACFITMRAYEQVRQYVGYMASPQILIGFGCGFSLTMMGSTHYALEDIALMRSIPNMTILAPCDAFEAVKAFEAALKIKSPIYIRIPAGTGTPIVHTTDFDYQIGKAIRLKEGQDVQIIATGTMIPLALEAAKLLDEEGMFVSVIDMHTIKPLDIDSIDMHVPMTLTIEEHILTSGLGDAVGEYFLSYTHHPRLVKMGVSTQFNGVGDVAYMYEQSGLTVENIIKQIKENINK